MVQYRDEQGVFTERDHLLKAQSKSMMHRAPDGFVDRIVYAEVDQGVMITMHFHARCSLVTTVGEGVVHTVPSARGGRLIILVFWIRDMGSPTPVQVKGIGQKTFVQVRD